MGDCSKLQDMEKLCTAIMELVQSVDGRVEKETLRPCDRCLARIAFQQAVDTMAYYFPPDELAKMLSGLSNLLLADDKEVITKQGQGGPLLH